MLLILFSLVPIFGDIQTHFAIYCSFRSDIHNSHILIRSFHTVVHTHRRPNFETFFNFHDNFSATKCI